ncbi:LOW QUALITY PROTEIN: hypothetical protein PanWU01x14_331810, partial [Parasponia andersonii]
GSWGLCINDFFLTSLSIIFLKPEIQKEERNPPTMAKNRGAFNTCKVIWDCPVMAKNH